MNHISISTLKKLRLNDSNIRKIPRFIKNLSQLRKLDLGFYISEIPDWFGDFAPLDDLNLSPSYIRDFSVLNQIKTMRNLEIRSWEPVKILNFDNLDKLESLNIRLLNNDFKLYVSDTSSIKDLDLGQNLLKTIPSAIKKMFNLENLSLFQNRLKVLPKWFSNLNKLEKLVLSCNQLETIPSPIKSLISLKKLDLRYNKIKKIPKWIDNLQNLKILSLDDNQIKNVPQPLCNLGLLESLSLDKNQIKKIPLQMKNLKNLQCIFFDQDIVSADPEIFKEMYSLSRINLKNVYRYIQKTDES